MFYIVHLTDAGVDIVIPRQWIKDSDGVLERHMFHGLKRRQTHLCYYGVQNGAIIVVNGEEIPNHEFEPNFQTELSNIFPCDEGTFRCNIVDAKGEHMYSLQFHFNLMRTIYGTSHNFHKTKFQPTTRKPWQT